MSYPSLFRPSAVLRPPSSLAIRPLSTGSSRSEGPSLVCSPWRSALWAKSSLSEQGLTVAVRLQSRHPRGITPHTRSMYASKPCQGTFLAQLICPRAYSSGRPRVEKNRLFIQAKALRLLERDDHAVPLIGGQTDLGATSLPPRASPSDRPSLTRRPMTQARTNHCPGLPGGPPYVFAPVVSVFMINPLCLNQVPGFYGGWDTRRPGRG